MKFIIHSLCFILCILTILQVEQDASVSEASPHIVNIGRMVEVSYGHTISRIY